MWTNKVYFLCKEKTGSEGGFQMSKNREYKKNERKEKDRKNKPYEIPNEVSCSPEFPQGCISWDN
jgi:hypothetical protein